MRRHKVAFISLCLAILGCTYSHPVRAFRSQVFRPKGADLEPAMRVTNNYKLKTQGNIRAGADDLRWFIDERSVSVRFCFESVDGRTVHLMLEDVKLEVQPAGMVMKRFGSGRVSSGDEMKWVALGFRVAQLPPDVTFRLTVPFREANDGVEEVVFDFAP